MSLGLGKVVFVFPAFLRSIRGEVGATKKSRPNQRNQTIIKETHPHIVEMFDSESARSIQTEIIEQCFKKSGKEWKLDLDKPFFKESKSRCVSSMEAHT
jgi:hypothetical protein